LFGEKVRLFTRCFLTQVEINILNQESESEYIKVLKVHKYREEIGNIFHNQNAIGISCFRDIRDVVVSTMKKSGKDFDYCLGNVDYYLQQFYDWKSLPNIHWFKYENLFMIFLILYFKLQIY
jgi:hypothetical protein